ncbi:MAG: FtsX-like permease family protein [Actinomycetota bacterium]
MGKVIRRGLVANRVRFAMTALAVILGVAFMSGTSIFTATLQQTFEELFADIYAGTDAVVRAPEVLKSDFGGSERPNIPESLLGEVRSVPGVAQAAGAVNQGNSYAQLVGRDGRAVTAAGPTFGIGWLPPKLNPWTIDRGRAPRTADEVVVDRRTVRRGEVQVGDRVRVLTAIGSKQYTLVGTAAFGRADSLAGASAVLFTTAEAQRVNNSIGEFGLIVAAARPGVDEDRLRDDIAAALARGADRTEVEVVTGDQITEESQQELRNALGFIDIALGVFAAVALAVGAFIIYNTFSIVVAQRSREMALLRALGASRRQVLGQVFGESVVVGVLASAVGVAVGVALSVGLRALLGLIGFELPGAGLVVPSSAVVTGLIAGSIITVASAVVPARHASRIPPIAALRATAIETRSHPAVRLAIGLLALGGGLVALGAGLFGGVDSAINFVGTGAVLVVLGTFVLGPLFAGPVARILAWPLPRLRGVPGRLARDNAARNP